MLLFDTNILVYAANKDSELHLSCRQRVGRSPPRPIPGISHVEHLPTNSCGLPTHPRVLQSPWGTRDALRFVSDLLASPGFEVLVATPRHAAVLAQTLSELPELRGNLVHDLHTAVLMREHGVSRICTRDADFRRFPFLSVVDPLGEW